MTADPAARFIPHPHADHARVLLGCPCGETTDLTFARDQRPETQACTGCGTDLTVPHPPAAPPS